jgi:hypothetical protein
MPVSVGEVFAGFTILRVLGAGGMGTVPGWLAQPFTGACRGGQVPL